MDQDNAQLVPALPVLRHPPASSEGSYGQMAFSETIQVPVCPSMEKGQQGHVENMSQADLPLCGPQRDPRAHIVHNLGHEALKSTLAVVLKCTEGNGRKQVGGVCKGGGEADPRDATSKSGHKAEDPSPAAGASCLLPNGAALHTDVKFPYRHEISTNNEGSIAHRREDQVRHASHHATTTLHHQQGSGVQQVFHGDRTGDAQLVYNVRPVEPRGGDTEAILSKLNIRPNRDGKPAQCSMSLIEKSV